MSNKVIQHDESMIPEGVVSIRPYGSNQPWRDVGNNGAGTLNVTTESRSLPNYRGGGGLRNSQTKVNEVTAAFTIYDISPENVALALRGTQHEVKTDPVVDELLPASGVENEVLSFKYLPDITKEVTVKTAGDEALVENEDYSLNKHGITILSDKVTEAGLKVSYTPVPSDVVDLLVGEDLVWEMRLLGTNAAQNDKPFKMDFWKVKINIAASMQIINDNYSELPVTLNVLVDDTVDDSGLGKFVKYSAAR